MKTIERNGKQFLFDFMEGADIKKTRERKDWYLTDYYPDIYASCTSDGRMNFYVNSTSSSALINYDYGTTDWQISYTYV
jgi:hypothetical protein